MIPPLQTTLFPPAQRPRADPASRLLDVVWGIANAVSPVVGCVAVLYSLIALVGALVIASYRLSSYGVLGVD